MINHLPLAGLGFAAILVVGCIFLLILDKPLLVIYTQIIYSCFMRILISNLHFPDFIKYFSDFLTVVLFVQIVLQLNKTKTLNIRKPMFIIILFLIAGIFSTAYNGASLIFFSWGMRTYIKFFVFFLACTIFLKLADIERLIKFLLKIFPVNIALVVIQYFVLGYSDDYIGGLFGSERGCNAEMNLYLIAIAVITIIFYVYKKIEFRNFAFNSIGICAIAALSELKIVFIIYLFVLLVTIVFSFPNKRAITISIVGVFILLISIPVFMVLYPNWAEVFSDINKVRYEFFEIRYEGPNTNSLSRLSAGTYISHNLLTTPMQKLFGIGFGNASTFLNISSSFYTRYKELRYIWFFYSLMLTEIGIIGLIIYCLFFLSVIYESFRIKRKLNENCIFYCYISFIISMIVFPLLVYNASLNMDAAFIFFFTFSFPFILEKETYESNIENKRQNRIYDSIK